MDPPWLRPHHEQIAHASPLSLQVIVVGYVELLLHPNEGLDGATLEVGRRIDESAVLDKAQRELPFGNPLECGLVLGTVETDLFEITTSLFAYIDKVRELCVKTELAWNRQPGWAHGREVGTDRPTDE